MTYIQNLASAFQQQHAGLQEQNMKRWVSRICKNSHEKDSFNLGCDDRNTAERSGINPYTLPADGIQRFSNMQ